MRKYTYFQALVLSFFSKDFYRDVANNHKGFGFKYILVLTTLFSVIFGFIWIYSVGKLNENFIAQTLVNYAIENETGDRKGFEDSINNLIYIVHSIPKITIQKGGAFVEQSEPITIKNPATQSNIITIDTLNKNANIEDTDSIFFLSSDTFSFYNKNGKIEKIKIEELSNKSFINENDLNIILDTISQIPNISFKNDSLTNNNKTKQPPFIIKNNKIQKDIAVISPNNAINNFNNTSANIIFSKNAILQKNGKDITTIFYSDIKEEDITSYIEQAIYKTKRFLMFVFPLLSVPIVVGLSFSFTVITLFLYGIIALSFANLLRIDGFTYRKAVRISAFAITPAIVLNVVLPDLIENQRLVYFIISIAYIYYAIKSTSDKNNANTTTID